VYPYWLSLIAQVFLTLVLSGNEAYAELVSASVAVSAWIAANVTWAAAAKFAIVIAASYALQYLGKMGKKGTPPAGVQLQPIVGGDVPRGAILGFYATAGYYSYFNTWAVDNKELQKVFVLGTGPHEGIDHIFANSQLRTPWPAGALTARGYPVNDYGGLLWVKFHDGSDTQATEGELVSHGSELTPNRWTSATRGVGVSYALVEYIFNEDIFPNGEPSLLFGVKGLKCYDPRKDSTNGLGSGAHRWGTNTTYEWTDNPAILLLNYQLGIWVLGQLMLGEGIPISDFDMATYIAAANVCDEPVLKFDTTTEKRYRVGMEINAAQDHASVINDLLMSMAGTLVDSGGIISVFAGAPVVPFSVTVKDSHIMSKRDLEYTRFLPQEELFNQVWGTYVEPNQNWQGVSYGLRTSTSEVTADGEVLGTDLAFPMVFSATQAQRLAELFHRLSRRQKTARIVLEPQFIVLEPGDWITWQSDMFGFTAKFVVLNVEETPDQYVGLTLREVDNVAYAWDPVTDEKDEPPDPPVNPGDTRITNVAGFAAVGVDVVGAGALVTPGVRFTWIAVADQTVDVVEFEYRKQGDTQTHSARGVPSTGFLTISQGILPSTVYEHRHRIITTPPRAGTDWTAFTTTTSGANQKLGGVIPGAIDENALSQLLKDAISAGGLGITPPVITGGTLAWTSDIVRNAAGDISARVRAAWTPSASTNLRLYEAELTVTPPGGVAAMRRITTTDSSYILEGIAPGSALSGRYRAVSATGYPSVWSNDFTGTAASNTAAPGDPTACTAIAVPGGSIMIRWTLPSDTDIKHVEVWEGTTNDRAAVTTTKVGEVKGSMTSRSGIATGQVRYYWVRVVNTSGVQSVNYAPVSATAGAAATVPSIGTGDLGGGIVDFSKIAAGYELPQTVGALPNPVGYVGPKLVYLTTDKKIYRYDSTVPTWTSATAAGDITGQLTNAQIADIAALKITGQLTSAQIADLAAAKLTGQITGTQITDGAITTPKIFAGSVVTASLAASAITASKMQIVGETLVLDPWFDDTTYWTVDPKILLQSGTPGGWTHSSFKQRRAAVWWNSAGAVDDTLAHDVTSRLETGIVPGREYRFQARVLNGTNQTIRAFVQCFDAANTLLQQVNVDAAAGFDGLLELIFTPADTSAKFKIIIRNVGGSTLTGLAGVAAVRLEQRASGTLIVDGAIIAQHVAAGAITADKLAIGLSPNMHLNSDFLLPKTTTTNYIQGCNFSGHTTGLTPTFNLASAVYPTYAPSGMDAVFVQFAGTPANGTYAIINFHRGDSGPFSVANMWPCKPGDKLEASLHYQTIGCTCYQRMIFVNAAGTQVGVTQYGSDIEPGFVTGGPLGALSNWKRIGIIAQAPAGAVKYYFDVVPTFNGSASPSAFFSGVYTGLAAVNSPLTNGTTGAVAPYAGVNNYTRWSPPTFPTIIDGAGIRTGSLAADRIVAGSITAGQISAGAIITTKLGVGSGSNVLYDASLETNDNNLAFISVFGIAATPTKALVVDGGTWYTEGGSGNSVYVTYPFSTPSNGQYAWFMWGRMKPDGTSTLLYPCVPGKRYEFSFQTGLHNTGVVQPLLDYYQADGVTPTATGQQAYGSQFSVHNGRAFVITPPAPAGAAWIRFGTLVYFTGAASPSFSVYKPYAGEALANQVEPSPWTPSGSTVVDGGRIVTNSVHAQKIVSASITSAQIGAGQITTITLDALAVTATKLAAGAVVAGKISAGAIDASNLIVSGVINAAHIQAGQINASHLTIGSNVLNQIYDSDYAIGTSLLVWSSGNAQTVSQIQSTPAGIWALPIGSYAALVNQAAAAAGESYWILKRDAANSTFPVTAGQRVEFSAYVVLGTGASGARLFMNWNNGAQTISPMVTTSYGRMSIVVTVPAGATAVTLYFAPNASAGVTNVKWGFYKPIFAVCQYATQTEASEYITGSTYINGGMIVAQSITANQMGANSVVANVIAAGAIYVSTLFVDEVVIRGKIAPGAASGTTKVANAANATFSVTSYSTIASASLTVESGQLDMEWSGGIGAVNGNNNAGSIFLRFLLDDVTVLKEWTIPALTQGSSTKIDWSGVLRWTADVSAGVSHNIKIQASSNLVANMSLGTGLLYLSEFRR
jgi:hypothetical protein